MKFYLNTRLESYIFIQAGLDVKITAPAAFTNYATGPTFFPRLTRPPSVAPSLSKYNNPSIYVYFYFYYQQGRYQKC